MVRKPAISQIQIRFVDPSGEQRDGPVLVFAPADKRRSLNHSTWTRGEAIRRFSWYLARNDQRGVEAAYQAAVRVGCLRETLQETLRGKVPNEQKTRILLSLWNTYGLWSLPRSLGDDLGIFVDSIRYVAPRFMGPAMTLYRGQSRARYERGVFGIAWTGRLAVARQFAGLRDTPGVVLKLQASPDFIAARVSDFISTPKTRAETDEFEDEYIVDPRGLSGHVTEA